MTLTRSSLLPALLLLLTACGSSGTPSTSTGGSAIPPAAAPAAPATGGDPAWASKIQPPLTDLLTTTAPTAKISISLWLDVALIEEVTKATSAKDPSVLENDARIAAAAEHARTLITNLGISFAGSLDMVPLVFAEATPDQIRMLAKRTEFIRIDFNDTTGIEDAG